MSFLNYILSPRLYKVYRDGPIQVNYIDLFTQEYKFSNLCIEIDIISCVLIFSGLILNQKLYEPRGFEKWSDQVILTVSLYRTFLCF